MVLLAAGGIFLVTFIAILRDRVDQTILAAAGAAAMLLAGLGLGFYSQDAALTAIDFNTLGLLLGMMVLVNMLGDTGFFQFVAIFTAKRTRGNPWLLLLTLGVIITLLSMFLPNVTTIVLMAPVSILIAEILGISPIPFLMSGALLSNTGGVATLVGDPPNILIGSAAGLGFTDFLVHLTPIVAVVWVSTVISVRLLFRKELSKRPKNIEALAHLDERQALHDPKAATRILIILALIVLLFLVESLTGLSVAAVALLGAATALLWVQPDIDKILKEIEWSVLVFFGGLFVLVGGLEASGALEGLALSVTSLAQSNMLLTGIALLWFSALLSAIIDNVPLTIVMIPLILSLGGQGLEVTPLWWALALGAGFGGNATPIGATPNLITIRLSQRTRDPITTQRWLRAGLPVTLVACAVATVLYVLTFSFM